MTFPKARLIVSAILFISWLGFLFYLVLEARAVIISRPQFQIAQTVAVFKVRDDGGKPDSLAAVKEILWGDPKLAGKNIRLTDLLACDKEQGYSGGGDYVIPLMRRGGVWQIAQVPIPLSYRPTHLSHGTVELVDAGANPDLVLDCMVDFAREKPLERGNLLAPFLPALVVRGLGRDFFDADIGLRPNLAVFLRGKFAWYDVFELPRGPMARLAIADAHALEKKLKKCGADVRVSEEEVRIYRWPEVRQQVEAVLAAKKK